MATASVLVGCCGDCDSSSEIPSSIVKRIIGVSELPAGSHVTDGVVAYPWRVDTKYYTADIRLCTSQVRTIGEEQFADSVQAVIIHFDTRQVDALGRVKTWLPYLKELHPSIQLLVCDQCSPTDVVSKDACLHWCLDHHFELVELDPEIDDSEDDFPETVGVERIIEALKAHMWSNMVMKEQPVCRSSYMQEMMQEHSDPADDSPPQSPAAEKLNRVSAIVTSNGVTSCDSKCGDTMDIQLRTKPTRSCDSFENSWDKLGRTDTLQTESEACWDTTASGDRPSNVMEEQPVNVTSECGDSSQVGNRDQRKMSSGSDLKTTPVKEHTDEENMRLFETLTDEDIADDSYEKLFEKLSIMKEKASNLPESQRRAYAEQVALSFLNAFGEDDDD